MTAGRCPYPVPAQRVNARVDLETDDPAPRWRARCRCGWTAGGYLTGLDGWRAIDRHREASQQLADLEQRGNR